MSSSSLQLFIVNIHERSVVAQEQEAETFGFIEPSFVSRPDPQRTSPKIATNVSLLE
jgi:hypothetical protein